MEFYIEGEVKYCGLSIFQSLHGAYTGSIIDTEERKRNFLSKYVDIEFIGYNKTYSNKLIRMQY